MTYQEQITDPRWQKKRLEILERDGWMCVLCQSDDKQLHVHHRRYFKKKKIWEYGNEFLCTLCCDCHLEVTELKEEIGLALDFGPVLQFYKDCRDLKSLENWVEIMDVFNPLCRDPKQVLRLHQKYFPKK